LGEKNPTTNYEKHFPLTKPNTKTKEFDSIDMESLHMNVKKLSIETIYLKKGSSEGSSKKPFQPFFKKKIPTPPKAPSTNVKLDRGICHGNFL